MSTAPLLVVVGPTASGKSALAAELGARLNGEVISADSVQLYRDFVIGAGNPSADELALCPHHLVDVQAPSEPIDAAAWAELADKTLNAINERGKRPIICGGTFLWIRALLYGLAEAPRGDEALRAAHRAFADEHGRDALHARLRQVDATSAERLHPNDLIRVSRALEVYEICGETLSAIQERHGFQTVRHPFHLLGVDWPRDVYDERVRLRVVRMLDAGFIDEVRELMARGLGHTRAMESVGYKQVHAAVSQAESGGHDIDRESLIDDIVRVTRIFARRQRTWLRDLQVEWILGPDASRPEVLDALAERLKRPTPP